MRVLGFIRSLTGRFPLLLAACTVLWLIVGLLEAAAILSIVPVVDKLAGAQFGSASPISRRVAECLESAGLPSSLGWLLALFLAFSFVKSAVQIAARYAILVMKYAVERELYLGTFGDFFRARWHFFASGKEGTLLNTFMRESAVVGKAFGAIALLFSAFLQLALCLAVPLYLSWKVTALSAAAAALFGAPFLLTGRWGYRLGQRSTSTANELASLLRESLGGAKLILGYGKQAKTASALAGIFNAHTAAAIQAQILDAGIPIAYLPLGITVMAIALLAGGRMGVALSESAALLYALMRAVPIIGQILTQKVALENFFPSHEQLEALRARARELEQRSGSRPYAGLAGEIRLEGVSFAHPGGATVLRELDIRIPKGKMAAIVGESGAGKSTVLDLLLGFHEPSRGKVTVDGIDLRELDIAAYRNRLGYVPQDLVLFNMSVRDNLLWAREDATEAQLQEACRLANADGFIGELERGLDTVVGDRGVRLSGGQAQRIALARAVLRKPELLLLDEATSALDSQSERLIQQAIERLAGETTVVVVAHRLSTVVAADSIFVLSSGKLVEQGDYKTLASQGGAFSRMIRFQELELAREGES